jgi:hypothetical protein
MQWMAAEQTGQGPRQTTRKSVAIDRLKCVFRACRRETTRGRQPRRDDNLVGVDRLQSNGSSKTLTHLSVPRRATSSLRNSSKSRSTVDRLGFTTKSNPFGISAREVRRISRILLLMRFLSCAFPSLRGVVIPNRLYSNPFRTTNTAKERDTRLAPPSYTLLNSAAFFNRKCFGNTFAPAPDTPWKALIVLNRYAFATLIASSFQHEPPAAGLHALAKTVCFRATPIIRLVRPLWHSCAPSKTLNLAHRVL